MMMSVCSVGVLETPVRARQSSEVVVAAAVNRTKANGTSMAVIGLVALGKTSKILVEKMLAAAGVVAQLLARIKTAKAVVAANPSSHHHQALLPHLRELARREAEEVMTGVEEEETQAGVQVVAVETMEIEAQEAEVPAVAALVMETPAEEALVEEALALALALVLAQMVTVEAVLAEEILTTQCLVLGLLSHPPWAAREGLMVPTWESWSFNWPSCYLQIVPVQTLALGLELLLLSPQAQDHRTHPAEQTPRCQSAPPLPTSSYRRFREVCIRRQAIASLMDSTNAYLQRLQICWLRLSLLAWPAVVIDL